MNCRSMVWGNKKIGNTEIQIPNHPSKDKRLSRYKQNKKRKVCRRRATIEPVIGHLKTDHRLSRNFYHKVFQDNINVMLATAAYNFRRMMNIWKRDLFCFILNRYNSIYNTNSKIFIKTTNRMISEARAKRKGSPARLHYAFYQIEQLDKNSIPYRN